MKRLVTMLVLIALPCVALAQIAKLSLPRSYIGITLGDSLAKVRSEWPLTEVPVLGLAPGEEVYVIVAPRGREHQVESILLSFCDGNLYYIVVTFTSFYAEKVGGWQTFIASAREEFGSPIDEKLHAAKWSDDKTSLCLMTTEDAITGSETVALIYSDDATFERVNSRRRKALVRTSPPPWDSLNTWGRTVPFGSGVIVTVLSLSLPTSPTRSSGATVSQ